MDKPYLIITSEQVSKEYLDYLDGQHISWIAVGKDKPDLAAASEILAEKFGVSEKMRFFCCDGAEGLIGRTAGGKGAAPLSHQQFSLGIDLLFLRLAVGQGEHEGDRPHPS